MAALSSGTRGVWRRLFPNVVDGDGRGVEDVVLAARSLARRRRWATERAERAMVVKL
jgi:hypothetical protein